LVMKTLCIIPARSGSKGIKNKNVMDFCGRPLLGWNVWQAKNAQVDKIIISTDSKEYIDKVNSWYPKENLCPFIRPAKLAKDDTPSSKVILHAIDYMEKWAIENSTVDLYDIVLVLEPTAPLRLTSDITIPLSWIKEGKCLSVVSVCDSHRAHPSLSYRMNRGFLQPNVDTPHLLRQQLTPFYHLTGTIYAAEIEFYKQHKTFITDKTKGYVVQSWQDMEIDEPDDIEKIKPFMGRVK